MIAIIDYGVGNSGSIHNMLKRIGVVSVITSDKHEIANASKIILPGVGAFDAALEALEHSGIRDILEKKALLEKVPVLGICLGMQLLTNGSEEGKLKGLGWIPAYCHKFTATSSLKVPHMSWNSVQKFSSSPLTVNFNEESKFYFVHSYYVQTEQPEYTLLKTTYGNTFDSAIGANNIMGVQFHPEKSHKYGMNLLANFAALAA